MRSQARLFGAVLLVAGTTIGAAMLAIPVSTGRAGFFPSLGVMACTWLYLVMAALYFLEVNLAFPQKGNIITMASHTLGRFGKIVSWSAYLFLLYALNTAYIAATSSVVQDMILRVCGVDVPQGLCVLPLLTLFGLLLHRGMQVVDYINRVFMTVLLASFCLLVVVAVPHMQWQRLAETDMSYVLPSLSVVVTAFGFHVIIPSLVEYLRGSVPSLKKAIWIGSTLPFVGYLVWQCVTLASAPLDGDHSIAWAYAHGKNGAQLITMATGSALVASIAEIFAICAIVTSFLGVSISLFDCLADGMKVEKKAQGKWKLFFITFVPPLYFALSYPRIFFTALETAGAFGVIILLALLPLMMCWRKRYHLHLQSSYQVPGGKPLLVILMAIAVLIIAVEVAVRI